METRKLTEAKQLSLKLLVQMATAEATSALQFKECHDMLSRDRSMPMKSMQKKFWGTGVLDYE